MELPVEKVGLGPPLKAAQLKKLLRFVAEGDEYGAYSALEYVGRLAKCGRLSPSLKLKLVRFLIPYMRDGFDPSTYYYDHPTCEPTTHRRAFSETVTSATEAVSPESFGRPGVVPAFQ